jgi:hypothetical protein
MLLSEITRSQQSKFALYCKTERDQNLIGTTPGRIHHYRRLIYNIIDESLRTAYPLTYNLLDKDRWDLLVNSFIANHKFQTPILWRMPEEFKIYLFENEKALAEDFPFIWDLLEFEWKEIEVYMMEDNEVVKYFGSGSFEDDDIVFNPDFQILKLSYPVHTKNAKQITSKDSGERFILIFRKKDSGEVLFVDLSLFHIWLISQLIASRNRLEDLLVSASVIFNIEDVSQIKQNALSFLNEMKEKQFILGFTNRKEENVK